MNKELNKERIKSMKDDLRILKEAFNIINKLVDQEVTGSMTSFYAEEALCLSRVIGNLEYDIQKGLR